MALTKEQFYKNSIWTFLELTSFPILVLFSTPFFIAKLGIEQYGLWMLINTITQGMNVLNIGVGDSSISLISKYRSNNQLESIKRVFHFNFAFSIFLFLIASIVGLIFFETNFVALFYKTSDYHYASSLLFLTCISVGLKFIEISILSIFKAFERFDINSKLSVTSKCSVVILAMIFSTLGYTLNYILIFTLVCNFLNILLQLFCLHQFDKSIVQWPSILFFKDRAEFIKYNFWYWLQSAIALIGFLTDKLAVAWFTDVKTMGYYYIASMVGTNIHNFFLSFGGFIFPRVSFKLEAKHSILPLYYVSRSMIAIFGWLIIFGLLVFGDVFFEMWLGTNTYINSIYFIKLYLIFEAGMLLIITPFYFINGSTQIKLNSAFEVLIRTSHFLMMLIGYSVYGVNGILYGLIISTFLNVPLQYYYFHKKVMSLINSNWLTILLPVLFLFGYLLSTLIAFKVIFSLAFFISAKIIYFDTAKPYIREFSFFRKIKA